jgi:hypothetical protein
MVARETCPRGFDYFLINTMLCATSGVGSLLDAISHIMAGFLAGAGLGAMFASITAPKQQSRPVIHSLAIG